jgi:hypothetical protein
VVALSGAVTTSPALGTTAMDTVERRELRWIWYSSKVRPN